MNFLKAALLSTIFKSLFLGQASASFVTPLKDEDSSKNVFVRSQASSNGCFECSVEKRTGATFTIDVTEATGQSREWTFDNFLNANLYRDGEYVAGWQPDEGAFGRYYFQSMDYGVLPPCTDSTNGRFEVKLQVTNTPSWFGTGKFQHMGATNDGVCLYRFVVYCNCGVSSTPSTPMPTTSSSPTSKPTMSPTTNPTSYPSLYPSENPSSQPTLSSSPSSIPSFNPSSYPTTNPTSKPVDSSNQAEVTVESEMTFDGVGQDEFESDREGQIQIIQDSIQEIVNNDGGRRLQKRSRHLQSFKEVTVDSVIFSSSGEAVVSFTITMVVYCDDVCSVDEVSDLADSALGDVTSTLTESISSGAFTETLVATAQEAGSAAFDNVSVDASSLEFTMTYTITSDSPTASPDQEVVFPLLNQLYITISGIIVAIISSGFFTFWCLKGASKEAV